MALFFSSSWRVAILAAWVLSLQAGANSSRTVMPFFSSVLNKPSSRC
ncbi:Uncharacterised protein [Klebsiella variicola]|uniref:Uncharacterized protein n=1 Tax=Klebsiella variicola TaxID=244366 RepID=A0A7H4MAQ1_KLEVA|nr:Uncharacterised protein [Klebsiella variicola]